MTNVDPRLTMLIEGDRGGDFHNLTSVLEGIVERGGLVSKEITGLENDVPFGAGYPKGHPWHGKRVGVSILSQCIEIVERLEKYNYGEISELKSRLAELEKKNAELETKLNAP